MQKMIEGKRPLLMIEGDCYGPTLFVEALPGVHASVQIARVQEQIFSAHLKELLQMLRAMLR